MKKCGRCKINKVYTEFYKSKTRKSGFRSQCKKCEKEYYILNADKIIERTKQYIKLNKAKIDKYIKKYHQTEQGRLLHKANKHKRRVLIKSNTPIGKHWTPQNIKDKFKLQHGKCIYCETSLKDYYEIDHIIPLCKGGSNMASNIQLLCKDCNGQSGKGKKLPYEFAQQHGKLI